MILLKMYTLTEEQRWYIIYEWKRGCINVSELARSFKCTRATIYHVINYYRRYNDVNYTNRYNAGRPPAFDSTQIEQPDRTIQQNRSVTAAELLSITHFNTTERTIQRYCRSLGYFPRKSSVIVRSDNISEQKRYEFAELHHRADIKNYIFENECYVGLRSTQVDMYQHQYWHRIVGVEYWVLRGELVSTVLILAILMAPKDLVLMDVGIDEYWH